jgi:CO dehydrogenase/acetyl-CoA synthase epsilon subunit
MPSSHCFLQTHTHAKQPLLSTGEREWTYSQLLEAVVALRMSLVSAAATAMAMTRIMSKGRMSMFLFC